MKQLDDLRPQLGENGQAQVELARMAEEEARAVSWAGPRHARIQAAVRITLPVEPSLES